MEEQERKTFWVARDWNGELYMYNHPPVLDNTGRSWVSDSDNHNNCDSVLVEEFIDSIFSSVRSIDEKPTEIEIIIKRDESKDRESVRQEE